jgi:NDP-sugar pyrophosphorylase family protein
MYKPTDLFNLNETAHAVLFERVEYAWEALEKIKAYILGIDKTAMYSKREKTALIGEQVFIGEGTVVEDGARIKGPAIIGRNCQIRHTAYIREEVIIGDACVVGNACEIKKSVLFNEAVVPHLNYVGDSILGHRTHLGAGVILSNFKSLRGNVTVEIDGRPFDTGLRKLGALLGDGAEVGCNSVLNPGSIIGRGAVIYPGVNWRGILPANMIAKNRAQIDVVVRRPR